MKVCKRCLKSLPLSLFYQRKIGIPYTLCRACYLQDKKERDSKRIHSDVTIKECTCCRIERPVSDFHKNRGGALGYCSICKDCAYLRNLQIKYKISTIDELIKERNGLCDICKAPFLKKPHVDHNHKCCPTDYTCGKCFRGLLCSSCNIGIGHFKDNPEVLFAASQYLKLRSSI